MKKFTFLILGHLFLILGVLGAFLPLLPTTPFLLLAAFFYSKSNERLHRWILSHKYFGPPLKDWENYGVIGINAKILATIMLGLVLTWRIPSLKISILIKIIASAILVSVLVFIWTRPSNRKVENSKIK